jgi:hypothetical protein
MSYITDELFSGLKLTNFGRKYVHMREIHIYTVQYGRGTGTVEAKFYQIEK